MAREKEEVKAPAAEPQPAPPPSLADKIRKLQEEQQTNTALSRVLLEIADRLETLGRALGR